jgi:hypothetical protein
MTEEQLVRHKEIPLSQGGFAKVDKEDFEQLGRFSWHSYPGHNTLYARRVFWKDGKTHNVDMHRAILNPTKGLEVDHIDGDGLNNQRSNLRIVTRRGNAQNRHMVKTSHYPGVRWHKQRGKWAAEMRYNGRRRHLGLFEIEEDAATTYRIACAVLCPIGNALEAVDNV